MDQRTLPCTIPGCTNRINAKGLCCKHGTRLRKYGDVNAVHNTRNLSDEEYLLRSIDKTDGCWLWRSPRTSAGYGSASRRNVDRLAHRFAYETWVGPIPEGLVVRHKCDVRNCVNPDHLEVGTMADNNRDTARRDRNGQAKITNADAFDIRWAHGLGATGAALARAYKVSTTTISTIVNYKTRTLGE